MSRRSLRHPLTLFAVAFHLSIITVAVVRQGAIVGTMIWAVASLLFAEVLARSWELGRILFYQGYGTDRATNPTRFRIIWLGQVLFWAVLNGFFLYGFLAEVGFIGR